MKTLVLGAGGMGGYFGGRLAAAGEDVTFLVRPKRRQQLAERGLVVRSPLGDLRASVKTVLHEELHPDYDLVLLTCKSYDLDSAIDSIAPGVGPNTRIVPLLNGLRHMDALDQRFGRERVLGGLCHIAAALSPDGEILHLNDLHRFTVGARTAAQAEAMPDIARTLSRGGFELIVSPDVERALWEKFVFITTLAAMTCLMRGAIMDIVATRDGRRLFAETLDACISVARASGTQIDESWRDATYAFLTKADSPMSASMMRDLERHGPTEGEHIVGDMLLRGEKLGIAAPTLASAWCHLQTYGHRRAREGW